jgi:hypothetical protein
MITTGQGAPGTARTCPHCRATILQSATLCPICKKSLKYDSKKVAPSFVPLRVEGTIRHPAEGDGWEYSVVIAIRNEKGEEVARQMVGVGALQPQEARTFTLSVEMFTPAAAKAAKLRTP